MIFVNSCFEYTVYVKTAPQSSLRAKQPYQGPVHVSRELFRPLDSSIALCTARGGASAEGGAERWQVCVYMESACVFNGELRWEGGERRAGLSGKT